MYVSGGHKKSFRIPLIVFVVLIVAAAALLIPKAVKMSDGTPEDSSGYYIIVNDNVPEFKDSEKKAVSFEKYSELDSLGRCGVAYACIGRDLMPTEERTGINSVKPTGWQSIKYDFIDGEYLYNRCHLIGFQLAGENANEKNLITGTRSMNVDGMLPFENMVADYVKETGNHVLYRVTPLFEGDNLLASGVYMEGLSVEDNGEGICFYVYVYNKQGGVVLDYATGASRESDDISEFRSEYNESTTADTEAHTYILNINSKKFHTPDCASVKKTKEENKQYYRGGRQALIDSGYSPCGVCNP